MLPLSSLATSGVAHIRVPDSLLADFRTGSLASEWLAAVPDGHSLFADDPDYAEFRKSIANLSAFMDQEIRTVAAVTCVPARAKKIEWEQNGWHYDIADGLTTSSTYEDWRSINAADRQRWINSRDRVPFLCTMPFPVDKQGPTVCVPWDSEVIQADPGCITVFALNMVFHRADSRGAPRGVWLKPVELPAEMFR